MLCSITGLAPVLQGRLMKPFLLEKLVLPSHGAASLSGIITFGGGGGTVSHSTNPK